MRSGDGRPWSMPNLLAMALDNREELGNKYLAPTHRARLIVETAALRLQMRRRILRLAPRPGVRPHNEES